MHFDLINAAFLSIQFFYQPQINEHYNVFFNILGAL